MRILCLSTNEISIESSIVQITDTPQILSGRSLAILDPQGTFSTQGGEIVDFTVGTHKYADQLASFNIERFVPSYKPGTPFEGTIIRLPLRQNGTMSRISSKSLSSEEVRQLLVQFVGQEMDISLLFLRNLSRWHARMALPYGWLPLISILINILHLDVAIAISVVFAWLCHAGREG